MSITSYFIPSLVLAAVLPVLALAQEASRPSDTPPAAYGLEAAAEVDFDSLLYHKRPVVVFADSADDPNVIRQIELLQRDLPALELRDVALILDTEPNPPSDWRKRLRPRGFSLVLMDKDLKPVIRKPLPWEVREIIAAIDKFPLRRQEMLERNPAGR